MATLQRQVFENQPKLEWAVGLAIGTFFLSIIGCLGSMITAVTRLGSGIAIREGPTIGEMLFLTLSIGGFGASILLLLAFVIANF